MLPFYILVSVKLIDDPKKKICGKLVKCGNTDIKKNILFSLACVFIFSQCVSRRFILWLSTGFRSVSSVCPNTCVFLILNIIHVIHHFYHMYIHYTGFFFFFPLGGENVPCSGQTSPNKETQYCCLRHHHQHAERHNSRTQSAPL